MNISELLNKSDKMILNPSFTVKEVFGAKKVDDLWTIGGSALILVFEPLPIKIGRIVYKWLKGKSDANKEKERMYQEVIRKQQAAINKYKEITQKLERKLQETELKRKEEQAEIDKLKNEQANLEELIDLLSQTIKSFQHPLH